MGWFSIKYTSLRYPSNYVNPSYSNWNIEHSLSQYFLFLNSCTFIWRMNWSNCVNYCMPDTFNYFESHGPYFRHSCNLLMTKSSPKYPPNKATNRITKGMCRENVIHNRSFTPFGLPLLLLIKTFSSILKWNDWAKWPVLIPIAWHSTDA